MNRTFFGKLPTGEDIYTVRLTCGGAEAEISSRGAAIISYKPFGREIVAGFPTLNDYASTNAVHGAAVGRVCNRIANAEFTMDGVCYKLAKNNGEHCLHGGYDTYAFKAWDIVEYGTDYVTLSYLSPDGESGFPSEVEIFATYRLSECAIYIEYRAVPKGKTPIMMTNHAYFNLTGFRDTVHKHRLKIYAEEYNEVSEARLPTGRHIPVAGTPYDFREPHEIGERMAESPIGYDNNFIVSPEKTALVFGEELPLIAEVWADDMKLEAYSNQPGVQLYVPMKKSPTAPHFTGDIAQFGSDSFCLETQIEPNCVNHGIGFIGAGELYRSVTVYRAEKV